MVSVLLSASVERCFFCHMRMARHMINTKGSQQKRLCMICPKNICPCPKWSNLHLSKTILAFQAGTAKNVSLSLSWGEKFPFLYKLWQNSNCDQTQKLKLWKNSTSQIAMNKTEKLEFVTKLKNLKGDKSLRLNLWQKKKKNPIVTKLKNPTCDKTQ